MKKYVSAVKHSISMNHPPLNRLQFTAVVVFIPFFLGVEAQHEMIITFILSTQLR